MDKSRTVAERLADHVVNTRFEDLPVDVVEHTKELLAFNLSVAFAGRFTEKGRLAVALAQRLSAGCGASSIVGHKVRVTLLDAIFAHSDLMAHNGDIHLGAKLITGSPSQPVAWVLGEHEHASGRELITALVVGYDAAAKLTEPVPMEGDYVRMPHKCASAPFGAAAITARLLRLDHERTAQAIARAAHLCMGVNEGYDEASVFPLMARNAVLAAQLPPMRDRESLQAIESPHGLYAAFFGGVPAGLEASLATLGREYSILRSVTKRFPGSECHVAPLETTHALLADTGLKGQDIESIVAVLPLEFEGRFGKIEPIIERPSLREGDLIYSLKARLAALVMEGKIVSPTLEQFRAEQSRDLLSRIELRFERRPEDYARIEIRTRDGRTLTREGKISPRPKGDLAGWLRRDGERFLEEAKLAKLTRLIANIDDVSDVAEVLACTIPD
ncbi:MAG: MmgE/PrpD family protein [Steroidobacterales bacterium]